MADAPLRQTKGEVDKETTYCAKETAKIGVAIFNLADNVQQKHLRESFFNELKRVIALAEKGGED